MYKGCASYLDMLGSWKCSVLFLAAKGPSTREHLASEISMVLASGWVWGHKNPDAKRLFQEFTYVFIKEHKRDREREHTLNLPSAGLLLKCSTAMTAKLKPEARNSIWVSTWGIRPKHLGHHSFPSQAH